MLKLASDADVHGSVTEYLTGEVDIVRVVDALPEGTPDPEVLEWAAREGRVLLTNDRSTMIGYAWERARKKQTMPGLIVLPHHEWTFELHVSSDVHLIAEACDPVELRDQVIFLPLKMGQLPHPANSPYFPPPLPLEPEDE